MTNDEDIAAKYPIRSFGGFEIVNIYPIKIIRTANGREVMSGENKHVMRGMARRLGMFEMGKHELVDPNTGGQLKTHDYAREILRRLNP
ncbi:MAG: hypothetical protein E5Y88_07400 [Mesorhizobium sp.]|uniref:hypothetical protein n=1 Tax=Mesorhizobium sp. TaxID=1871066 RepID=UPI000FE45DAD|nr:hypothetical protein [Mesorhizobium sp.]RWN27023.1 MAG: hypothetical protein EOR95_25540 [Mesorhizobium sp.]RWP49989.1 MAG: hypothetical protein EOR05_09345 [Mesorhizobium sp.]RWQ35136.1 MAG: hypothetical protein EOS20_19535 [Mesorhizobium sp.]TIL27034.1 MAG: hypothetical protein E5Y88_07400 [Mesorhizobium sp.]